MNLLAPETSESEAEQYGLVWRGFRGWIGRRKRLEKMLTNRSEGYFVWHAKVLYILEMTDYLCSCPDFLTRDGLCVATRP
jgi:hypothetical protein